jgi:hypothetical protein
MATDPKPARGPAAPCWLADTLFPIPDRRASPRIRLVCFDVRIGRGGRVGLYRARNISDAGMMLQTGARFDVGESVLVELAEPFAIEGKVSWSEQQSCGIEFVRPIDCAALLAAQAGRKRDDRRGGGLRLATMRLATAYAENGIRAVRVTNVSHRGMGLAHDGFLEEGMLLKLIVESGVERSGRVRWSRDGRAGLRLLEPLSCEELETVGRLELDAPERA